MNWLILLALVLFMAFLEGINAGTEERLVKEARDKADAHRAQLFAGLLAACFNGEYLTDGERTIHCKVKKP